MLDAAGFEDAVIAASNDLDEMLINDLKIQGAAITSWGVGTHLITSKDCPSFGGVYKLAAIEKTANSFRRSRFQRIRKNHESGKQNHLSCIR